MINELSNSKDHFRFCVGCPFRKRSNNLRYINPPQCRGDTERLLKYEYAADLVKHKAGNRNAMLAMLDGKFIAGDFIGSICL